MTTCTKSAGISLIGILIGLAAGAILISATALLIGRGFNLSREQTEQVRITEDARIQMERMSDAIRDARSLDLTGDGRATFPAEVWLQSGQAYDIQFYTNVDTDAELERLHYFLEGTELKRGLKDPYTSEAEEQVVTLARSLRNIAKGKPLFRYYLSGSDTPLTTPVISTGDVERVEILLYVDVDESQIPTAVEISTVVAPRASDLLSFTPLPTPTPTPTPTPNPSFSPPGPGGTSP